MINQDGYFRGTNVQMALSSKNCGSFGMPTTYDKKNLVSMRKLEDGKLKAQSSRMNSSMGLFVFLQREKRVIL